MLGNVCVKHDIDYNLASFFLNVVGHVLNQVAGWTLE